MGNLEWGKYLIEKGALVEAQNKIGTTPFEMIFGHIFINPIPPRDDAYILADLILAHGGSINRQDEDGETCLHWAAKTGNLEAVNYLLEKGAKILPDQQGKTPIKHAKARRDEVGDRIAQLLIDSQMPKN